MKSIEVSIGAMLRKGDFAGVSKLGGKLALLVRECKRSYTRHGKVDLVEIGPFVKAQGLTWAYLLGCIGEYEDTECKRVFNGFDFGKPRCKYPRVLPSIDDMDTRLIHRGEEECNT